MKRYVIFAAILLAVAGSAFTSKEKSIQLKDGEIYWLYQGDPGDEGVASEYVEVVGNHPTCSGTTSVRCNILAERDPINTDQPKLSTELTAFRTFFF
jgi:hypothetical protein